MEEMRMMQAEVCLWVEVRLSQITRSNQCTHESPAGDGLCAFHTCINEGIASEIGAVKQVDCAGPGTGKPSQAYFPKLQDIRPRFLQRKLQARRVPIFRF
jgi:hypothetical protein